MPKVKVPRQWKFASIPSEILESTYSTHAKLLIGAILFHSFDDGPAWPGTERLARLCSCSKRQVLRAIQELEEGRNLKVGRTDGKVNIYEFLEKTGDSQSPVKAELVTHSHHSSDSQSPVPVTHSHPNKNKSTKPLNEAPPSPITIFTQWYCEAYALENRGKKYLHQGAKDAQAVKRLVATFSLDTLQTLVKAGWATPDRKDFSTRTICMTLSGFSAMVNQLAVAPTLGASKPAESYLERTRRERREEEQADAQRRSQQAAAHG